MPLSPSEAREQAKEREKKLLTRLYTRIDASLVCGRMTFTVPEEIERRFLTEVVNEYGPKGWLITLTGDDMDGGGQTTKVVFSEKAE